VSVSVCFVPEGQITHPLSVIVGWVVAEINVSQTFLVCGALQNIYKSSGTLRV
jgi:hypothetical protein